MDRLGLRWTGAFRSSPYAGSPNVYLELLERNDSAQPGGSDLPHGIAQNKRGRRIHESDRLAAVSRKGRNAPVRDEFRREPCLECEGACISVWSSMSEQVWRWAARGKASRRSTNALEIIRPNEAEMCRLKGELLLMDDNTAAAEAAQYFRDAMEVARRQHARSWELRATMSPRSGCSRNRAAATRGALLSDVYGWFTEGFDTATSRMPKRCWNTCELNAGNRNNPERFPIIQLSPSELIGAEFLVKTQTPR